MLEKVPYGVYVRIYGDDENGYYYETAWEVNIMGRIFPSLIYWVKSAQTFNDLSTAKKYAIASYNYWVGYCLKKKIEKKISKKIVMKIPEDL